VVTALTSAQERSTSLLADGGAPRNAALFVEATLREWGLERIEDAAAEGVMELAAWVLANGSRVLVSISVVWDSTVLITEVSDHGDAIPFRPAWLESDPRAVATLERACMEWDAELRPGGRCLWAAYATGCPDPAGAV
jgi:hypothetical protein